MSTTIKISDELLNAAKRYASVYSRSVPKQIEYWSRIGQIAEDNPDLPYSVIRDMLLAVDDVKDKNTTPYQFG